MIDINNYNIYCILGDHVKIGVHKQDNKYMAYFIDNKICTGSTCSDLIFDRAYDQFITFINK